MENIQVIYAFFRDSRFYIEREDIGMTLYASFTSYASVKNHKNMLLCY